MAVSKNVSWESEAVVQPRCLVQECYQSSTYAWEGKWRPGPQQSRMANQANHGSKATKIDLPLPGEVSI